MYVPFAATLLTSRAIQSRQEDADTTIQLPTSKPGWAEHLSPQLAAFSIEMDRWPDWAGYAVGQPNTYTNQLLKNLGERTGMMPYLRVGANSQDRTVVDFSHGDTISSDFPEPTPDVPNPEADKNYIGKDYYALSGNMPEGTWFQWGLNLKYQNLTETVAQAALLADTFQGSRSDITSHVHLAHVEIGNEPDFYGDAFPGRPGPLGSAWTPANYSQTWAEYAEGIDKVIQLGGDGPKLSPGALTGFNAPIWTPGPTLQAGILDNQDLRAKTDQYTEHIYFGGFGAGRLYEPGPLMDKLATRANFSTKALPHIQSVRKSGLKYVFGEMNSYANHGIPGLSNTLESAIWGVDFMLLTASHGVERCHFHHGVGFQYNTFQPIAESDDGSGIDRPHILPLYNAFLLVNEAIGKTGDSWVAEIGTQNNSISAYGIYENKQLTRMVVINHLVYRGEGERPSFKVKLAGWQNGWSASVKTLTGPKTDTLTGVTWAGQSFETESGLPEGEIVTTKIEDGWLDLEASSVALLSYKI